MRGLTYCFVFSVAAVAFSGACSSADEGATARGIVPDSVDTMSEGDAISDGDGSAADVADTEEMDSASLDSVEAADSNEPADTAPFSCPAACEEYGEMLTTCFGGFLAVRAPALALSVHGVEPRRVNEMQAILPPDVDVIVGEQEHVIVVEGFGSAELRAQWRDRLRALGAGPELPITYDTAGRRLVNSGRLLVRFTPETTSAEEILAGFGLSVVAPLRWGAGGWVVTVAPESFARLPEVARRLGARADVRWAAVDYLRSYVPRGGEFDDLQWSLADAAERGAAPNADIAADGAWTLTTGDPSVIIAIFDDGVDAAHPDLVANIVPGYLERSSCGGGWCGHGTSVAGVAGARGDNDLGGSGVCPDCAIMPAWQDLDISSDSALATAFTWLADHNASVINNSWGPADGDPVIVDEIPADVLAETMSPVLEDAFTHMETQGRGGKGTVVVFAAGNGNELISADPFASHPLTIGVAAMSDQGVKSYYSDFGPEVDVAAPSSGGVRGIFATAIAGGGFLGGDMQGQGGESYTSSFGGTSSASPATAGVAGLILSANPALTAAEVRQIIKDTAEPVDRLRGEYDADTGHSPYYGAGRVHAHRAVLAALKMAGRCPAEADELCNGVDDDCDGEVDEDCAVVAACGACSFDAECGAGAACSPTPGDSEPRCLLRCEDGGRCADGSACEAGLCVPTGGRCAGCMQSDVCNGVDDDCDGQTDEDAADTGGCPEMEGCLWDAQCAGDEICVGGGCRTPCQKDANCEEEGATCVMATGLYGAEAGRICGGGSVDVTGLCASLVCASGETEEVKESLFLCLEDSGGECLPVFQCVQPWLNF